MINSILNSFFSVMSSILFLLKSLSYFETHLLRRRKMQLSYAYSFAGTSFFDSLKIVQNNNLYRGSLKSRLLQDLTKIYSTITNEDTKALESKNSSNIYGAGKKDKKLQISFDKNEIERLNYLSDLTKINSKAQIVRESLLIFDTIVDKMKNGYRVVLEKGNESVEIISPTILSLSREQNSSAQAKND